MTVATTRKRDVDRIASLWSDLSGGGVKLTPRARRTIARFLAHLSVEEVEQAAREAVDRIPALAERWRYFCGLVWVKMRQLSLARPCVKPPEGELVVGFLPGGLPFLARVNNGTLEPIRPPSKAQLRKAGTVYIGRLGGAAYEH